MNILVGHLDGSVTLRQLAILASVWKADLADDSFNIPDVAYLCNLPRSTASSVVARLRDGTANGMGFITLEMDSSDRRRKFVRPSRHLKNWLKPLLENTALTYGVRNSYEEIFQHLADCR